MKQNSTELEGKVNNYTVMVGHINTPLSVIDRASRQEIDQKVCTRMRKMLHYSHVTDPESALRLHEHWTRSTMLCIYFHSCS